MLNINELSDILRVHKNTIYTWMKQGMPHYMNGKTLRFKLEEVEEWLKEGE
ncbi:MAG: helix-turn-helix domain-containing protein [Acidaminococcaceae bacterium]|jgi:excisionase family DNA binding protein|nr:helix-turn-helix domain-containing protein [Acidaminococcaceae bacterium]